MFNREKATPAYVISAVQAQPAQHGLIKKNPSLRSRYAASRKLAARERPPAEEASTSSVAIGDGEISRSRTLLIVFSSLAEFPNERKVLRQSVLPELQQHCSERDVDLSFCYLYGADGHVAESCEQLSMLADLVASESRQPMPTSSELCILFFLGDRYGELLPPASLRPAEFQKIQTALFEQGAHDARLLEQYYLVDKSQGEEWYRLHFPSTRSGDDDSKSPQRLSSLMQAAIDRVRSEEAQQHSHPPPPPPPTSESTWGRLSTSFIETAFNLVTSSPITHLVVSRKFQGYEAKGSADEWADASPTSAHRINALKQRVSLLKKDDAYTGAFSGNLPCILDLNGTSPEDWFSSKNGIIYERHLASKLSEMLKLALRLPSISLLQHRLGGVMEADVAEREHEMHSLYMAQIKPANWVIREPIDHRLSQIIEAGMKKSVVVIVRGGTGSGKTATFCHLHQLLDKRGDCLVVSRFGCATDTSLFASELLRNILLKIHQLLGLDQAKLAGRFRLASVMAALEELNSNKEIRLPVFVLIDDFHLLRFGRALHSQLHELATKTTLLSKEGKLSFVLFTSSSEASAEQLGQLYPNAEQFDLPMPNVDQMLEITKAGLARVNRKLGGDHLGALRNILKKPGSNLINAKIAAENLLMLVDHDVGGDAVESRFDWLELRCGVEEVTTVASLVANTISGISTLELLDAYRVSTAERDGGEADKAFSYLPLLILRLLGSLLVNMRADDRGVWLCRHASINHKLRHRYLHSSTEIKRVNEVMGKRLMRVSRSEEAGEEGENDASAARLLLFPQPLYWPNSESDGGYSGVVNVRRARFHWHYLLYAGNAEDLKKEALCSFDYLETVLRGCGLAHLFSIFEEVLCQILDHDLLVIFEQVLLPSINTLVRDERQLVSEFLNRLRYTRSRNSKHLNECVEQAMRWTDNYDEGSLLVPLTCWIAPRRMKQIVTFAIPQWTATRTLIQPTHNHQHLLIAGNEEGKNLIYMYHIASQLLVRTFTGHEQTISSLTTSNDGCFFISTSHDGSIKKWNLSQTSCMSEIKPSEAKIHCLRISKDDKWIAIGSADSTARVIRLEDGSVWRTFREHTGPVVDLQLASEDELLVTGSGDFAVMVWDIEAAVLVTKLAGLMAPVTCLAITSNDSFVAVACADETLRIFSLISAQELHEMSSHDSRVIALAASADDCQLFTALANGKVLVYDIHNGRLIETLQCVCSKPVTSLKISDDNTFILAFCGDTVHIWNMNSIERDHSTPAQSIDAAAKKEESADADSAESSSTLSCVRLAPDEKGAGCGTVDGILAFWDLEICQCLWTTAQQKEGLISALEFTVDSMYLLSGNEKGTISMWEVSNGRLVHRLQVHQEEVYVICCFPDGLRMLSSDRSNQALIWNLTGIDETAQVEIVTIIPGAEITLYGRLNDTLVVGRHSKNANESLATAKLRMNVWAIDKIVLDPKLQSYECNISLRTKAHHNDQITCYGINRSSTWFVTGSLDLSIKVWQADTGFLTQVLVGHEDVITCCTIGEQGKVVVSASRDLLFTIWDVKTGNAKRSLRQASPIKLINISQDSSVVIAAAEDGWISAWSTEEGAILSSFNTHRQVEMMIMNVDGNRILGRLANTPQLPILCLHNTPARLLGSHYLFNSQPTRQASQHRGGKSHLHLQATSSFTSHLSHQSSSSERPKKVKEVRSGANDVDDANNSATKKCVEIVEKQESSSSTGRMKSSTIESSAKQISEPSHPSDGGLVGNGLTDGGSSQPMPSAEEKETRETHKVQNTQQHQPAKNHPPKEPILNKQNAKSKEQSVSTTTTNRRSRACTLI